MVYVLRLLRVREVGVVSEAPHGTGAEPDDTKKDGNRNARVRQRYPLSPCHEERKA